MDKPLIENARESSNYATYLRSSSWEATSDLHNDEETIKRKLRWYFKNPYEKYKDRGRKPYKLLLQVLKIVLVTIQATLFAIDEFSLVQFEIDNIETFRHIFLKDYDPTLPYEELYTKESVYSHMMASWRQYYNYNTIMIGSYETGTKYDIMPILYCKEINKKLCEVLDKKPKHCHLLPNENDCYHLKPPGIYTNSTSLQKFIKENQLPTDFDWILSMTLHFSFNINYTNQHMRNAPDCYKFNIKVTFDNEDLDGIIQLSVDSSIDFHQCRKTMGIHITEKYSEMGLMTAFDMVIIVICCFSLSLCIRSFRRHWRLGKDATQFFREYRHERLTRNDKLSFLSFWLVLITLSDICIIGGSILKAVQDWWERPELYTYCSLLFGLAVLFSWIGVLRYLGFMRGYNILLVTLKTAFPAIMRFIICVSFIYLGFTICGWIIFGPYHQKFRNIYVTSECLFALINGDDMYATFSEMEKVDGSLWLINKLYLYIFISLFIFVVLGLFIGIVADTYERIKDFGHAPKSRMELFMEGKEYKRHDIRQANVYPCHHRNEDFSDDGHESDRHRNEDENGEDSDKDSIENVIA